MSLISPPKKKKKKNLHFEIYVSLQSNNLKSFPPRTLCSKFCQNWPLFLEKVFELCRHILCYINMEYSHGKQYGLLFE